MLILQSRLASLPVASIQASHRIGLITGLVIQPKDLLVAALIVDSPISSNPLYLHTDDIVELRPKGVLINHNEQLMEADDLVRLDTLLERNFKIVNKKVVDDTGRRVGTTTDYVVNSNGWQVQKIHTEPTLIKMLNKPDRVIDRSQIVRVSDKQIVVKSAQIKKGSRQAQKRDKQMLLRRLRPEASASKRD